MIGIKLGLRWGGGATLVQQALSILAKYGSAANLYLPGVGAISGIQAGNWFDSAGTTAATVDNPVGRVNNARGGANLVQATTANKPVLRFAGGIYSWQFDGSNDSFTSTLTTGNEGWVCAGVKFSDANSTFFSSGATAANAGVWLYRNAGGAKSMNMAVANGSAIAYSPDITPPANTPVVVSGGWTATTVFAGVNNTETNTTARSGISASTLPLRIGLATDSSYALNGLMSAIVYCTILPSAADRALIRKFVASLSGVTL